MGGEGQVPGWPRSPAGANNMSTDKGRMAKRRIKEAKMRMLALGEADWGEPVDLKNYWSPILWILLGLIILWVTLGGKV